MTFESFILIGGKSSRMGVDKFSLVLNGKTFLEIAFETLKNFGKVSAVMNMSEPSAVADSLSVINDIYKNRGALGGIHSALTYSKSDFTIILACDYPFVTVELIEFLTHIAISTNEFAAFAPIQADGKIQPLCAIYKTEICRKVLSEMLANESENYSVRDFLNRIKTRYIQFSETAHLQNSEHFFFNVNTPEDFERAKPLSINVEKMMIDDIEEVLKIQRESNLSYWSHASYRDEIKREDSCLIVAKLSNQTVGFLGARIIEAENCAEIYNIGVDVDYRRKKIGEKLLEKLVKTAVENNLEKIFLEARESNETAIQFYVQNDFSIIGKRKKFYSNPTESAILMEKKV